jgi:hypothetical protein
MESPAHKPDKADLKQSGLKALLCELNWNKILRRFAITLLSLFLIILVLYLTGAVFYNGPFAQAGWGNGILASLWLAAVVTIFFLIKDWKRRTMWLVPIFLVLIVPYLMIQPSNDRDWEPEFKRTGSAEVSGDIVTLTNVRNFTHRGRDDFDERWESRTFHLTKLRGLDYFQSNFYGDILAHPILSFDFGDEGRICLSVETRREVGEKFTPIGGLYKIFDLQYLFITEDDCIPLRTMVREETVRRYTIDGSPEHIRKLFLAALEIQNGLEEKPQFYNVINANCTTSLNELQPKNDRIAWEMRLLFNGKLDECLYEQGLILKNDLSFEQLRKQATINEIANASLGKPDFSKIIRESN